MGWFDDIVKNIVSTVSGVTGGGQPQQQQQPKKEAQLQQQQKKDALPFGQVYQDMRQTGATERPVSSSRFGQAVQEALRNVAPEVQQPEPQRPSAITVAPVANAKPVQERKKDEEPKAKADKKELTSATPEGVVAGMLGGPAFGMAGNVLSNLLTPQAQAEEIPAGVETDGSSSADVKDIKTTEQDQETQNEATSYSEADDNQDQVNYEDLDWLRRLSQWTGIGTEGGVFGQQYMPRWAATEEEVTKGLDPGTGMVKVDPIDYFADNGEVTINSLLKSIPESAKRFAMKTAPGPIKAGRFLEEAKDENEKHHAKADKIDPTITSLDVDPEMAKNLAYRQTTPSLKDDEKTDPADMVNLIKELNDMSDIEIYNRYLSNNENFKNRMAETFGENLTNDQDSFGRILYLDPTLGLDSKIDQVAAITGLSDAFSEFYDNEYSTALRNGLMDLVEDRDSIKDLQGMDLARALTKAWFANPLDIAQLMTNESYQAANPYENQDSLAQLIKLYSNELDPDLGQLIANNDLGIDMNDVVAWGLGGNYMLSEDFNEDRFNQMLGYLNAAGDNMNFSLGEKGGEGNYTWKPSKDRTYSMASLYNMLADYAGQQAAGLDPDNPLSMYTGGGVSSPLIDSLLSDAIMAKTESMSGRPVLRG